MLVERVQKTGNTKQFLFGLSTVLFLDFRILKFCLTTYFHICFDSQIFVFVPAN